MKKKYFFLLAILAAAFFAAGPANAQVVGGTTVQTNSATSIYSFQATLNGYISNPNPYVYSYAWFQWGTSESYGNETTHQNLNNSSGPFSQQIGSLSNNTTYHFRAVIQNTNTTSYGQDMTFTTSGSQNSQNAYLSVNKYAMNLTSGNLSWQKSVYAKPGDLVSIAISLEAKNGDVHNVFVQDVMPQNLIYRGNLLQNTSPNTGSITQGINIGTIYLNQPVVLSYQAQIAGPEYFSYGTTTLITSAQINNNENGAQQSMAVITVNKANVEGATYVPTGLTNNFLTDSFFLPLIVLILAGWIYFKVKKFA